MTLALVRQRYAADGGAERFVARALSTLQGHGWDMMLVTRHWQATESVRLLSCDPFYIGSLWRDWGFARSVCKSLARHPVDIVQSHERIACCDIYRAGDGVHREWLKQRRRALGLWSRIRLGLSPYHYYTCWAEKRVFASPQLHAVICNSRMVKDEIKQHFHFPEDKLHVIYSGVDTQTFHPTLRRHRSLVRDRYAIPQQATLFLFVGSGFERKGVGILLEAMVELPDHVHLLIVGKDKKMHTFLARVKKLMLTKRVYFVGAQQDVESFYGAADAFVLPTLYDPFPNVVLEAMASGLPVITSTKCGAAELIENNKNGYVCDALDKVSLVEVMKNLLCKERRERLGDMARKVAAPMTLDHMGKQLLDLYKNLTIIR